MIRGAPAPPPIARWTGTAALVALLASSCARQEPPPGGPEDQRPPVVVRTVPEPFDTVSDLDEPIRFDFDERISERVGGGTLNEAITISPRGGEVEVRHGRSSLTLRVRGGLRPGVVYRVTLQPVVSDMFGNAIREPFELVFTTGPEPVPTTLAGEVWDRVTGRAVADAVVQAIGADSLVHQASSDRQGIYAFRYLTSGELAVYAFEDVNRNRTRDSTEVQGVAPATLAPGDTLLVDLPILRPDTTPAILRSADALDSVTVVLEFDDFLDPDDALEGLLVGLERDEGSAPTVERMLHEAGYALFVEEVTDSLARLDSIAAATAPPGPPPPVGDSTFSADTTAVADSATVADSIGVADSTAAGVAAPERRGPPTVRPLQGTTPGLDERTGRLLPSQRLVALLASPLVPEVSYTVRVSGARNVNGLAGGGGEAEVALEAADPDTLPVDTLAGADTTGVDTLGVARR